jgi:hypothetical protein
MASFILSFLFFSPLSIPPVLDIKSQPAMNSVRPVKALIAALPSYPSSFLFSSSLLFPHLSLPLCPSFILSLLFFLFFSPLSIPPVLDTKSQPAMDSVLPVKALITVPLWNLKDDRVMLATAILNIYYSAWEEEEEERREEGKKRRREEEKKRREEERREHHYGSYRTIAYVSHRYIKYLIL